MDFTEILYGVGEERCLCQKFSG